MLNDKEVTIQELEKVKYKYNHYYYTKTKEIPNLSDQTTKLHNEIDNY